MTRTLVIGPLEHGSPFSKLIGGGQASVGVGATAGAELLCPANGRDAPLREALKRSGTVVLAGDAARSRAIIDDIWHLLRQKTILSTAEDLSIEDLKSMCPLSKVVRGYMCIKSDVERNLIVLSADSALSDAELDALKLALKPLGDSLLIREDLLEAIAAESGSAAKAISDLLSGLIDSSKIDRDLSEYILGYVLYGVGDAAIKGKRLGDLLPQNSK